MNEAEAPPTEIRLVRGEDYAVWLELWSGYQRFYDVDILEAATTETWARLRRRGGADVGGARLACRGGGRAGALDLPPLDLDDGGLLLPAGPFRGGRRYAASGSAAASSITSMARAARAGCPRVYWLTHETNLQAMRLYDQVAEKSGFVHYWKRF